MAVTEGIEMTRSVYAAAKDDGDLGSWYGLEVCFVGFWYLL